jgi:hypothetical protein
MKYRLDGTEIHIEWPREIYLVVWQEIVGFLGRRYPNVRLEVIGATLMAGLIDFNWYEDLYLNELHVTLEIHETQKIRPRWGLNAVEFFSRPSNRESILAVAWLRRHVLSQKTDYTRIFPWNPRAQGSVPPAITDGIIEVSIRKHLIGLFS